VRGRGVEDAAELVPGQPERGRVVGHLGPADVGDGGVGEDADLEAIVGELGEAGQPAGDRGSREGLAGADGRLGEQLTEPDGDVVAAGLQRVHAGDGQGPAGPGAQVGAVGRALLAGCSVRKARASRSNGPRSGRGSSSSAPATVVVG
jgi:hypothetical protein